MKYNENYKLLTNYIISLVRKAKTHLKNNFQIDFNNVLASQVKFEPIKFFQSLIIPPTMKKKKFRSK